MQPKNLAFGTLVAALLFQVTLIRPRALTLNGDRLAPILLGGSVHRVGSPAQADINEDGQPEELTLVDGSARILSGGKVAWQSPKSWQVTQTLIADLNRDGVPEAALLVWRPFRPWPVDEWLPSGGRIETFHDVMGDSCHLILIGWARGQYRELWAGSALAEPVRSFLAADLNGDGLEELVTLEGSYQDPRTAPARVLKVWKWNGFGFSNVSSMNGRFEGLVAARSDNGQWLILAP